MIRTPRILVCLLILLTFTLAGCASKKFVRTELAGGVETSEQRSESRMGELSDQIESNQSAIAASDRRIDQQAKDIENLSDAAKEAMERALEAGKLAEGRLIAELVLSNEDVRFGLEDAELDDTAKAAIDTFAAPLKSENTGIYIEIQGHTDATGEESYNLSLGEHRAESVRRYLNMKHSIPLHRIGVISYGESAPAFDNSTPEGRQKNRRVVLVVLR